LKRDFLAEDSIDPNTVMLGESPRQWSFGVHSNRLACIGPAHTLGPWHTLAMQAAPSIRSLRRLCLRFSDAQLIQPGQLPIRKLVATWSAVSMKAPGPFLDHAPSVDC